MNVQSNTTRRAFLKGAPVAIAATAAAGPVAALPAPTIDQFLAKASASERARYHAGALAEAMNEIDGSRAYRSHINHEHGFAIIVGNPNASGAKVKVHIDDGSPLLADDVTGTTAYADWERGRI